jgi:hypothetical protein
MEEFIMMNVANNTMSRMLADDLGLVETTVRPVRQKMHNTVPMGTTPMMQVLADDTGAFELTDARNYPAFVRRNGLVDFVRAWIADVRAEREHRRNMHDRMLRAFAEAQTA